MIKSRENKRKIEGKKKKGQTYRARNTKNKIKNKNATDN